MKLKTPPRLGVTEWLLVIFFLANVAAYTLSRLPATQAGLAAVEVLAKPSDDASRLVAFELRKNPSLTRADVYTLREHVMAIEAAARAREANPQIQAMAEERQRLAAIPFMQMDNGDRLRWLVLALSRHVVLIVGVVGGCVALLVVRRHEAGNAATSGGAT